MVEFIALMAMMTSLVALSIDAMLPALSTIGEDLAATTPQQPHLIVSLFFLGMALGQLFFGPFSDSQGRRKTIFVGMAIFAIGTTLCMLATSMETMLAGRIVQAFGVSGPRIAALAIVRDKFAGEAMARVMSFVMMVFVLVPMIAPLVGQFILQLGDWLYIFGFFFLYALTATLWYAMRQPETLAIEKRRPFRWSRFFASSRYILSHPVVMGYTLASGCIFGAFLAYISSAQSLFQGVYDTGQAFPFFFALLAFAIGLASFTNGKLVVGLGMRKLCNRGLFGLIGFAVLQIATSLSFDGIPPLWLFVTLLFCSFFCVGVLFGNLSAIAMQPLGEMAGLGAAMINSVSGFMAVPIAILIGNQIDKTVTPIGAGFLVFALMALTSTRIAERQANH